MSGTIIFPQNPSLTSLYWDHFLSIIFHFSAAALARGRNPTVQKGYEVVLTEGEAQLPEAEETWGRFTIQWALSS